MPLLIKHISNTIKNAKAIFANLNKNVPICDVARDVDVVPVCYFVLPLANSDTTVKVCVLWLKTIL
ncbi:hypothetical protein QJU45_06375 [Pasteurella atlantica]|nr:hypothetical protein [Pasteurella atlantica]MDP8099502.1 hypothetical protein [Pasteurella atlantica]MDP8107390.1 hypothetical protein [Pasteurella atlantica]MDP8117082.1 hypothetical protein [Pasteurella atlantica]